jgi:hypothetical protein
VLLLLLLPLPQALSTTTPKRSSQLFCSTQPSTTFTPLTIMTAVFTAAAAPAANVTAAIAVAAAAVLLLCC